MRSVRAAAVCLTLFAFAGCGEETEPDHPYDVGGCDEGRCDGPPTDGICDGYPRLILQTPPGVCVGLVTQGLKKPRGIAELANGDLIVAEMGSWDPNKGGVWRLRPVGNAEGRSVERLKLLSEIDRPSGVVTGPDGLPYVASADAVFRFDPTQLPKPRLTLIAKGLPVDGRHPLKHFVFSPSGDAVYVNVGSHSDVCEKNDRFATPCWEEAISRGAIRKYPIAGNATTFQVVARGLRNSMALAFHTPSGKLIQAENSRDAIAKRAPELADNELDLPHEELNVVVPNAAAPPHFGWPYCYDNGASSPEYRSADCTKYLSPALLLPGHAAPLGMEFYTGTMFPAAYRNNLIIGYHGYRETGHRIAVIPFDATTGTPNGEPLDVVRGWDNPVGGPVDILVAKDGSIYVTDDKTNSVLRVFYDPAGGDGAPMTPLAPVKPLPSPEDEARCADLAMRSDTFSQFQKQVIDPLCVGCHGAGPGYPGNHALLRCDTKGNATRLREPRAGAAPLAVPYDLNSEIRLRLLGQGFPQMPAGGVNNEQLILLEDWLKAGAPIPN